MFEIIGIGVSMYGLGWFINKFYPYAIPYKFAKKQFKEPREWVFITGSSDGLGKVFAREFF